MKSLQDVLKIYKRNFITTLDVGDHLFDGFDKVLNSNRYHIYSEDIKDKYITGIFWIEYGDWKQNRLWVKLKYNNRVFIGYVDSPILVPAMIDRSFFIDLMDHQATNELVDIMFEIYREEIEK